MPDPNALGNLVSGFMGGIGSSVVRWTGYFVYSFLILAVLVCVYLFFQYRYKITIYKIEGDHLARPKKDRARLIKDKGVIKWKLFLTRKKIKPVDYSHIYKGNRVYLLRAGIDNFIPMEQPQQSLIINDEGGKVELKTLVTPVDEDVTYWYQLQQHQNVQDYLPEDVGRKQLFITLGTIVLCLILCGFTVWLVFKNVQPIVSSLDAVTKTPWVQNVASSVAPN